MSKRMTTEQVVTLSRIGTAATTLSFATIEHRLAIRAGHQAGLSVRQIAFAAGVHPSTVQRIIEQARDSEPERQTP